MLLSAVSVLVVAHSSSEIPEGLMNNPVYRTSFKCNIKLWATFIYLINDEDLIHILTYCILKVTYVLCEYRQHCRLRISYRESYVLRVGLLLGFVHCLTDIL